MNAVRPVHGNPPYRPFPANYRSVHGMVFAVEELWVSRKNCLDT